MRWTAVLEFAGGVSGLTLGQPIADARSALAPQAAAERPFERGSDRFFLHAWRELGVELMSDAGGRVVRISCLPASGLQLADGRVLFALSPSRLVAALAAAGFATVEEPDGFFSTSPERFGGRWLGRELVVFTVAEPGLKARVLRELGGG